MADNNNPNMAKAPVLTEVPFFAATGPDTWQATPRPTTPAQEPRRAMRGTAVDWELVRHLKREVTIDLDQARTNYVTRHNREPSDADLREMGRPIIASAVAAHAENESATGGTLWTPAAEDALVKAIFDSHFGFGRLQPLLEIPTAENITINGHDSVVVVHNDGRRDTFPPVADSDEELMEQLQQMARNARPARAFDASNLDMTLMVGDNFRIHAISNEVSVRPSVAIRQHLLKQVSLADLADLHLMPIEVAQFLDAMVLANRSIVVSGEQGVGKTTLLRALVDAIPPNDRFATLETDLELFAHRLPGRENALALYARSGMGEQTADGQRVGQVGISTMVEWSLRQSLQRIIVGEVRGSEASAMFQAMQTGAGTMSTTHSRDASSTADRLASRVAEGNVYTFEQAMRQVAMCIDLIIYVTLIDDTWRGGSRRRFISSIEYSGGPSDSGRPSLQSLYQAGPNGEPGTFTPPADLADELARHTRGTLNRYGDRGGDRA